MLARNGYNADFGGSVAFWRATETPRSHTGDRGEFVGRNRTLSAPAALFRERLAGRTGAGLDPCGALQLALEIEPGESRSVAFVLGQGRDRSHAIELAARYSSLAQAQRHARRGRAHVGRDTRRRTSPHTRRFVRSHREPLAALPDIDLSHLGAERPLSARRRLRFSRSAPGRPRADVRAARPLSRAPPARRVDGSSSRETCSTGGTRRAGAGPGHAAPMICSGSRTPSPATCRRAAMSRVLDEVVAFLEGPPLEPDQSEAYQCCRV